MTGTYLIIETINIVIKTTILFLYKPYLNIFWIKFLLSGIQQLKKGGCEYDSLGQNNME